MSCPEALAIHLARALLLARAMRPNVALMTGLLSLLPLASMSTACKGSRSGAGSGAGSSAAADTCGPASVSGTYAEAPAGAAWYDSGDVWVIGDAPGAWDDGGGSDDGSSSSDDSSSSNGDDSSGNGDDSSGSSNSDGNGNDDSSSSGDDDSESTSKRVHPRAARHASVNGASASVRVMSGAGICAACVVTCAVDGADGSTPAAVAIQSRSSVGIDAACQRAQRSAMTYAHAAYGRRVRSCMRGAPPAEPSSGVPSQPAPRTPASPRVGEAAANATETQ